MKSPYLLARAFLFFVLLPISFLYGILVFLRRVFTKPKISIPQKVISVGNIQVGGTGKTPLVSLLCKHFKDKSVVISRNYGAKNRISSVIEVKIGSEVSLCGDEALEIKRAHPETRVFSGPVKSRTALFASSKVDKDAVFIIDDGAQHLKLKRDLDIIVWDLSRSLIDFFPFPFGLSREFWFSKINNRVDVLNRFDRNKTKSLFFAPKNSLVSDYHIKNITNDIGSVKSSMVLISGIGNFEQLKSQVCQFLKNNNCKELTDFIKAKDHDDFSWFTPDRETAYLMTKKDYTKLSAKINKEQIHIIESGFSQKFEDLFLKNVLL